MRHNRFLKIFSVLQVIFLIIQYILGMSVNMFDNFDNMHIPGHTLFEKIGLAYAYAHSAQAGTFLLLHFVTASALLLIALILVIYGAFKHIRFIWIQSLLILITLFIAANSGAAFLASHQNNYYSLAMAIAFLIAFGFAISMCVKIFISFPTET